MSWLSSDDNQPLVQTLYIFLWNYAHICIPHIFKCGVNNRTRILNTLLFSDLIIRGFSYIYCSLNEFFHKFHFRYFFLSITYWPSVICDQKVNCFNLQQSFPVFHVVLHMYMDDQNLYCKPADLKMSSVQFRKIFALACKFSFSVFSYYSFEWIDFFCLYRVYYFVLLVYLYITSIYFIII